MRLTITIFDKERMSHYAKRKVPHIDRADVLYSAVPPKGMLQLTMSIYKEHKLAKIPGYSHSARNTSFP